MSGATYFSLDTRRSSSSCSAPLLMGVLNVTPDSFSDGGRYARPDEAYSRAMTMIDQGADIIDIGGESTRPGAGDVSIQQELDRVIPVVEKVASDGRCLISVDTSKVDVMREAVAAGAGFLNDVRGFAEPEALAFAVESTCPVCFMHMRGEPKSMQENPEYNSVVDEVAGYLQHRIEAYVAAGGDRKKVVIDPGFGFGKSLQHNLALFANLESLHRFQAPILVGVSRKSMFQHLLGLDVKERLTPSVVAASLLMERGAAILRVHDVPETRDAITLWTHLRDATI